MNKQILERVMNRLHSITVDLNMIQDLMGAPMDKDKDEDPNEHKWMYELNELIGKIADANFEAYGKCYCKKHEDD